METPILRHLATVLVHLWTICYCLLLVYECYLLWFTNDTVMTLLSAYVGYQLMAFSTTLPVCLMFMVMEYGNHIRHNIH